MRPETLKIGALAARAAVTPDALRYYERLGLLAPPRRTASGYRLYDPAAVDRVEFIRKAQALGLTLEEVREVLRVADAGTAPCEHVRAALARRLREVDARIAELSSLRRTLARAISRSRRLPLPRFCVCGIIESQPLPRPKARRPAPRRLARSTSHTNTRKEAS